MVIDLDKEYHKFIYFPTFNAKNKLLEVLYIQKMYNMYFTFL